MARTTEILVNASDLERQIADVERGRLRSLVDVDLVTARALHADDYELVTPGGETYTKDEYLGEIESGALDYEVFEAASPIDVRPLGRDAVVVRYRARIVVRFGEGHEEGQYWHTDVYERRDGAWQVVRSHATGTRRGAG
jgi:hypothetical protein